MENLKTITDFFSRIWDLFEVEHPLLGIPFSVIYLGAFAVAFSVTILRPLLGIGGGIVKDMSRQGHNTIRSAKARKRASKESYANRYERGE